MQTGNQKNGGLNLEIVNCQVYQQISVLETGNGPHLFPLSFVPWDVCPLGRFFPGTFFPWDVKSLGRYVPWDVLGLRLFHRPTGTNGKRKW